MSAYKNEKILIFSATFVHLISSSVSVIVAAGFRVNPLVIDIMQFFVTQ